MTNFKKPNATVPNEHQDSYWKGREAFGEAADTWAREHGLMYLEIVRFEQIHEGLSHEEAMLCVYNKVLQFAQIDHFVSVGELIQKEEAERSDASKAA